MSDPPPQRDEPVGILYAASTYVFWGVIPLYWRLFGRISPIEVTVHRVVWSALLLTLVMAARGRLSHLLRILRDRRLTGLLTLTSVLIAANWTIYIYCVSSRQLVEASLGYYITPLVSIALGVAMFGERISRLRFAAIALAVAAVIAKTFELGHVPWIAPGLALSFGFYGYFRKLAPVPAMEGLAIETWVLFPLTFGLVVYWWIEGTGTFPAANLRTDLLLMSAGPVTAIPLTLFAAGVRRIRMTTLGFLQYLSPSITLLVAVTLLGEQFTRIDAVTFGFVWAALLLVAAEGPLSRRAAAVPAIPPE